MGGMFDDFWRHASPCVRRSYKASCFSHKLSSKSHPCFRVHWLRAIWINHLVICTNHLSFSFNFNLTATYSYWEVYEKSRRNELLYYNFCTRNWSLLRKNLKQLSYWKRLSPKWTLRPTCKEFLLEHGSFGGWKFLLSAAKKSAAEVFYYWPPEV